MRKREKEREMSKKNRKREKKERVEGHGEAAAAAALDDDGERTFDQTRLAVGGVAADFRCRVFWGAPTPAPACPPPRSKNSPVQPIRSRGTPSPCGRNCGGAERRPARARPAGAAAMATTLFCDCIFFFGPSIFFFLVSDKTMQNPTLLDRLFGCSLPIPTLQNRRARSMISKGAMKKENAWEEVKLRAETAIAKKRKNFRPSQAKPRIARCFFFFFARSFLSLFSPPLLPAKAPPSMRDRCGNDSPELM